MLAEDLIVKFSKDFVFAVDENLKIHLFTYKRCMPKTVIKRYSL